MDRKEGALWICPKAKECKPQGEYCGNQQPHEYSIGCKEEKLGCRQICIPYVEQKEGACPNAFDGDGNPIALSYSGGTGSVQPAEGEPSVVVDKKAVNVGLGADVKPSEKGNIEGAEALAKAFNEADKTHDEMNKTAEPSEVISSGNPDTITESQMNDYKLRDVLKELRNKASVLGFMDVTPYIIKIEALITARESRAREEERGRVCDEMKTSLGLCSFRERYEELIDAIRKGGNDGR